MKFNFILLLLVLMHISGRAQNDCPEAITVCGDMSYIGLEATGIGDIQEIGPNACSQGTSGDNENNTIWLRVLIKDGGTLGFVLTPISNNLVVDFDFWLFGPNVECDALGIALRCSTTNPLNAQLDYNTTGMNEESEDVSEGPGADGDAFVNWITVEDDDILYLVIDRPHGFSDFSLEWTGTATFHEAPYFNNPDDVSLDISLCDTDGVNDGFSTFDLTTHETMLIGSQTDVELTYHTTNNDALTGVNPINNPDEFINTTNPQTIYMRMTNTITGCYEVETFDITVFEIPIFHNPDNIPLDIALCDPDDGNIFFDLTQYETMFNGGQTNVGFFYYANEADLLADIAIEFPVMYEPEQNPQTIYVKASNLLNEECFSTLTFEISTPVIAGMPQNLHLCDSNETGIREFDLSQNDDLIKNGETSVVIYYATYENALIENEPIDSLYENENPYEEEIIYARKEIIGRDCYDIVTFTIDVMPLPFVNSPDNVPPSITLCDEDGINDEATTFNLRINEDMMAGTQENLIFTYYTSIENVENNTPIDTPVQYINTSNPQTIFFKIENTETGCSITQSFTIQTQIIIAGTPQDIALCDTENNGIREFDLSDNTALIQNGSAGAIVTYHISETDAEANSNPIDPLHENQTPYTTETIWARIQQANGICFDITSFTLTILPLPVFINPQNINLDLSQCDNDGVDDQSDSFDLTIHESMLRGSQENISFKYFVSLTDVVNNLPITSPWEYNNISNPQTIYVIMVNDDTGCISELQSFELEIINPVEAGFPIDMALCDFNEDGFQMFNLAMNDFLIIQGVPFRDVTYYTSFEDAENGTNPIPDYYQNATPYATQTIWARIEATDGCLGHSITSFSISINPLPVIDYSISTIDLTTNDNSISIHINNQEYFEYSMDGENYYEIPYFDGLEPGVYDIYIRSKDGCSSTTDEVVLLNYPKFFTPNGDGINDHWQVFFLYFLPHSKVTIFDRYGKLVSSFWGNSVGWDGMYNGHALPSTDYWFLLELETGRVVKGHFAMVR